MSLFVRPGVLLLVAAGGLIGLARPPDVLVQSHSTALNLCFYNGAQFPEEYRGDIFAAFHGSWNRTRRTGYKIVRVPFDHRTGKTRGEYQDFVTGFVTPEGDVWGRPVGITVAKDGSLLFSEDAHGTDLAERCSLGAAGLRWFGALLPLAGA